MPAYVIADIAVSDPAKYEGYKALSPAAVEKRLSRGVIQQEQQQILGDTCHGRRMT